MRTETTIPEPPKHPTSYYRLLYRWGLFRDSGWARRWVLGAYRTLWLWEAYGLDRERVYGTE